MDHESGAAKEKTVVSIREVPGIRKEGGEPHPHRHDGITAPMHMPLSAEPSVSALLFAREDLRRIGAPAFPYAAFADLELRGRDQPAGVIGFAAIGVLSAFVA